MRHVELFVLLAFLCLAACCNGRGCLDVSEYPRVVFPSLTEQHEAEIFHQCDITLVWDGK